MPLGDLDRRGESLLAGEMVRPDQRSQPHDRVVVVQIDRIQLDARSRRHRNLRRQLGESLAAAQLCLDGDRRVGVAPARGEPLVGIPAVRVESVDKGMNAMPPKGMCFDCSADDFKALIEYMVAPK